MATVAEQVSDFRTKEFGGGPVIGLHLRKGNGASTGHDEYWRSFADAIERCAAAVRRCREELGPRARVFLCTDTEDVERAVRKRIPNVFRRRKQYRKQGAGEMHLWDRAYEGREDALVEMLLLAECDALIRYPPGSFFSFYAAVMGRWKTSRPETVYELQSPWTADDPLAPAMLMQ